MDPIVKKKIECCVLLMAEAELWPMMEAAIKHPQEREEYNKEMIALADDFLAKAKAAREDL